MAKHILHKCDDENCNVCRGGLALCTVCGGAEGSMPKDCPGKRMSGLQSDDVYAGRLNYIGDQWMEWDSVQNKWVEATGLAAGLL